RLVGKAGGIASGRGQASLPGTFAPSRKANPGKRLSWAKSLAQEWLTEAICYISSHSSFINFHLKNNN
ncbi:MAG TPA: hypothetical protein VE082_02200, partial [Desulfobaccales bacterium]|nr:hypothetical protein [Desulfobaccales bacterium]